MDKSKTSGSYQAYQELMLLGIYEISIIPI